MAGSDFCDIFKLQLTWASMMETARTRYLAVPGNILGSGSASPLTRRAFATFVNDGKMWQPYSIAKVPCVKRTFSQGRFCRLQAGHRFAGHQRQPDEVG